MTTIFLLCLGRGKSVNGTGVLSVVPNRYRGMSSFLEPLLGVPIWYRKFWRFPFGTARTFRAVTVWYRPKMAIYHVVTNRYGVGITGTKSVPVYWRFPSGTANNAAISCASLLVFLSSPMSARVGTFSGGTISVPPEKRFPPTGFTPLFFGVSFSIRPSCASFVRLVCAKRAEREHEAKRSPPPVARRP